LKYDQLTLVLVFIARKLFSNYGVVIVGSVYCILVVNICDLVLLQKYSKHFWNRTLTSLSTGALQRHNGKTTYMDTSLKRF